MKTQRLADHTMTNEDFERFMANLDRETGAKFHVEKKSRTGIDDVVLKECEIRYDENLSLHPREGRQASVDDNWQRALRFCKDAGFRLLPDGPAT